MTGKMGPENENNEYQDKVTISIKVENGQTIVSPEEVFLKNKGQIELNVDGNSVGECEVIFKMGSRPSCPFTFDFETGSRPSQDGHFKFPKGGHYKGVANQTCPTTSKEEIWEYDVVINGEAKDPVIRLKTTPDEG